VVCASDSSQLLLLCDRPLYGPLFLYKTNILRCPSCSKILSLLRLLLLDSHARSSKYFMTALGGFSTQGRILKYLFPITHTHTNNTQIPISNYIHTHQQHTNTYFQLHTHTHTHIHQQHTNTYFQLHTHTHTHTNNTQIPISNYTHTHTHTLAIRVRKDLMSKFLLQARISYIYVSCTKSDVSG